MHAVVAVVVVVVVFNVKCGAKFSSTAARMAIQTVYPNIQAIPQTLQRAKQNKTKKNNSLLRLLVSTMSLIYVDRMRKLPWSECMKLSWECDALFA